MDSRFRGSDETTNAAGYAPSESTIDLDLAGGFASIGAPMPPADISRLLPSNHFSTEAFDPSLRFEAWRQFLPLYTAQPHPDASAAVFGGRIATYAVGAIGIGVTAFAPHAYTRTRRHIAADGQDHVIVQLVSAGALHVITADGREIVVNAGDVWVHDLARPKTVTTNACRTHALLLSCRDLQSMTGAVDLDGLVLRRGSPLGMLLGQHLVTLARAARRMSTDEAPDAALGTLALVAACLRPDAQRHQAARTPLANALKDRIKAYIELHLFSHELTPEALCGMFGLSRSHLYRLFAPEGGIAAFIRHRRLGRAESLLRDPANARRTIADIAFDCGFVSEAHFSRAFRASFGLPPREVRNLGLGPLDHTILDRWEAVVRRD